MDHPATREEQRRSGVDGVVECAPTLVLPGTSGRLSVCLYTPSFNPSGMGGHMLDLAAEYALDVDVSVMAWPTQAGRRLLDRSACRRWPCRTRATRRSPT